jgi:hypothetical protein
MADLFTLASIPHPTPPPIRQHTVQRRNYETLTEGIKSKICLNVFTKICEILNSIRWAVWLFHLPQWP